MENQSNNLSSQLSAIVLCKNEATALASCLLSLQFCDQIIVADDGSSDDSVKIARKHGAKVYTLTPTDSFAAKRNQALLQVDKGWVLFVDADEVVTPQLAASIQKAVRRSDVNGFLISRSDVFMGKRLLYGEAGNMWLLRLARVSSGTWKRTVHEVWNVKGGVGRIHQGELRHVSHPTLTSFFEKINRYTDLEARERRKHHPHAFILWLQLFVYPVGKFVWNYIALWGYLDGVVGLCHAYCMSMHSLLVRIKTLEHIERHV